MKLIIKKEKNKVVKFQKIKFLNSYYASNKRFVDCMRKVFGINYYMALQVSKMCGFSLNYKISFIPAYYLNYISDFFISYFLVERGLKKFRNNIFLERKENGSIAGFRLFKGLPVNGQRTHTNSKTVRRMFKLYNFNEI
jgi:small subunit ribosomal protein S13